MQVSNVCKYEKMSFSQLTISSLNQPPTIASQIPFFFIALCWWVSIFPPWHLYLTWPHLFGCARTLFCHFRRTDWHTRHFRRMPGLPRVIFRGCHTSRALRLTLASGALHGRARLKARSTCTVPARCLLGRDYPKQLGDVHPFLV